MNIYISFLVFLLDHDSYSIREGATQFLTRLNNANDYRTLFKLLSLHNLEVRTRLGKILRSYYDLGGDFPIPFFCGRVFYERYIVPSPSTHQDGTFTPYIPTYNELKDWINYECTSRNRDYPYIDYELNKTRNFTKTALLKALDNGLTGGPLLNILKLD